MQGACSPFSTIFACSVTLASHYPKAVGRMDVVADAKVLTIYIECKYYGELILPIFRTLRSS